MEFVWALAYLVLTLYWYLLIIRLVYDIVLSFVRDWRPRGASLVLASVVFAFTDPPLRWLRSKIPPLNLGGISLDLGFLILLLVVVFARVLIPLR